MGSCDFAEQNSHYDTQCCVPGQYQAFTSTMPPPRLLCSIRHTNAKQFNESKQERISHLVATLRHSSPSEAAVAPPTTRGLAPTSAVHTTALSTGESSSGVVCSNSPSQSTTVASGQFWVLGRILGPRQPEAAREARTASRAAAREASGWSLSAPLLLLLPDGETKTVTATRSREPLESGGKRGDFEGDAVTRNAASTSARGTRRRCPESRHASGHDAIVRNCATFSFSRPHPFALWVGKGVPKVK